MANNKKIDKIILNIYNELYKKSTPSADFNKLIETGEAKKELFFRNYYLDDKVQNEIIEKELSKHKIPKWKKEAIKRTVLLGASPSSVKNK
jgi:hypothetical protein